MRDCSRKLYFHRTSQTDNFNTNTKMFRFLCFVALLAFAFAAPIDETMTEEQPRKHVVQITDSGSHQDEDGSYSFHFRGEDGSFREESAVVINPGSEHSFLQVSGSYSFYDVNGKEVVVHYMADDHGFVPEGNNISQQIAMAAKQTSQLSTKAPKQKSDAPTEITMTE